MLFACYGVFGGACFLPVIDMLVIVWRLLKNNTIDLINSDNQQKHKIQCRG